MRLTSKSHLMKNACECGHLPCGAAQVLYPNASVLHPTHLLEGLKSALPAGVLLLCEGVAA
jgi:hypothetical protein